MREKMEFVEDFFAEDREITVVEFFLALLVAFLFSVLLWFRFFHWYGVGNVFISQRNPSDWKQ